MNTLQTSHIINRLNESKQFQKALSLFASPNNSNVFPLEIEGLDGSLPSFFVSSYGRQNLETLIQSIKYSQLGRYTKPEQEPSSAIRDLVLLVPTEIEAQD